ncbi:MAG: hypothetical protein K2X93_01060 [Candidatus Obscuribacterales bacterium]|nr:hypothetical protein [Candidatus Obscuribacterales bacterium]
MQLRIIPLTSLLLTSVCFAGPAAADPLDLNPFKKTTVSDDLFNYMDDKNREERRREEEKEYKRDHDDQSDDSTDRKNILKKFWMSDFTDTDFSKKTFRDFKDDPGVSIFTDATGAPHDDTKSDGTSGFASDDEHGESDDDDSMRSASADAFSGGGDDWSRLTDYRKRMIRDEKRTYKSLTKPNEDALHDWVPSSVDPIQNGGFSTAEDNGSPVPYKLNGWINLDKGFPWGEGDP